MDRGKTETMRMGNQWAMMIKWGERQMRKRFGEAEIAGIVAAFTRQVQEDGLTWREMWEMGMDRIAAIVGMHDDRAGERLLGLGELAGMYLKEMAGAGIAMCAGYGGRPRG